MKPLLRRVAYWTLPPGIQQLIWSTRDRLRPLKLAVGPVLARNEVWRNYHANDRRCFILAAGPSIKQQDLTLLQGEICIAVSNFFVHKDYDIIRPMYHCVPDVLVGHKEYITEEYAIKWFREMENATGQAVMFFSDGDKEWIEREGLFKNRTVHYLHFSGGWDNVERTGIDLTRAVPGVQSVSVMALEIALFMGFKEIYLLGCDHDWILHYGTSAHFYPEAEHVMASRPGYNEWSGTDVESECRNYVLLCQQYKALRSIAQSKSIDIMNSTPGGMLDVFPRIPLETACIKSNR